MLKKKKAVVSIVLIQSSKISTTIEGPADFALLERRAKELLQIKDGGIYFKVGEEEKACITDNESYLKALSSSKGPLKIYISAREAAKDLDVVTNPSVVLAGPQKPSTYLPGASPKLVEEVKKAFPSVKDYHPPEPLEEGKGSEISGIYERVCKIGEGQFGQVWLLRQLFTRELHVEKRIPFRHGKEMIEREIMMMERLYHSHLPILKLWYKSMHEQEYVLITDFYPCGTLRDQLKHHISTKTPFPEYKIRKWAVDLIAALSYLADTSVVHRDVKPDNIVISEAGELKLIDFGIAQKTTAEGCLSNSGSSAYQAPEVKLKCFPNTGRETCKLDIWSLGCILFELCTLTPFCKHHIENVSVKNIKDAIEACYGKWKPAYSDQLLELICLMLNETQSKRISAERLADADYFHCHYLQEVLRTYKCEFAVEPDPTPEFSVYVLGKQVYKVRPTTSVKALKVKINKDLNYIKIILRCAEKVLENHKTLGECHVVEGSRLDYSEVSTKKVSVQVTLLDTRIIDIKVLQGASGIDVKEVIREATGMPVASQHLFFAWTKYKAKTTIDKHISDNDFFPDIKAVVLKEDFFIHVKEFIAEEKKKVLGEEEKQKEPKEARTMKIMTRGNGLVEEIKENISFGWKVAKSTISLYYKCACLKDGITMTALGIHDGGVIVVIIQAT